MKIVRFILSIFLISNVSGAIAQGHFEATPAIEDAYQTIMSLRLQEGAEKIKAIKLDDPNNLLVYHIENYIDFLTVFINEDKEEFKNLEKNKNKRLKKIKKGDKSSPYYRFSQAEIRLQWAVARSKFYDDVKLIDWTLINDFNKAYHLLEANQEAFPQFFENKKSLSVIHALASYLPSIVKRFFRVEGSLEQGLQEIEDLIAYNEDHLSLFAQECHAIHSYMLLHLFNQPEKSWNSLQKANLDPKTNALAAFLLSTVALKTGRNEEAITLLTHRPYDDTYFSFPYMDFLLGKALLYKLDTTANTYLEKFIHDFRGRHFIKEAYQKLAWYHLAILDDEKGYNTYMQQILRTGSKMLEDDKQAEKEAKQSQIPNKELLKIRLLYDGGYYTRALKFYENYEFLQTIPEDFHPEFFYRKARILHALHEDLSAIANYLLLLDYDYKNSFFACNSLLQCGLLYEKRDESKLAGNFFRKCLNHESSIYEEQLHNKAKAGLDRLNQK